MISDQERRYRLRMATRDLRAAGARVEFRDRDAVVHPRREPAVVVSITDDGAVTIRPAQ